MRHAPLATLHAGLDHVLAAPPAAGTVVMVVRRPGEGLREVLEVGELDPEVGLVGDDWRLRGSRRTADGGPHPEMQLNVVSARVMELLGGDAAQRALAGDQLHVDLDLSEVNLPPGTRLAVGTAVVEVTAEPHRGCAKFAARFGDDARLWVNEGDRRGLRLRGLNAKVVSPGTVRPGDAVRRIDGHAVSEVMP